MIQIFHRVSRKSVLRTQTIYVRNTVAQESGYRIATRLLNVNKNQLRTVGYQHLTSAKSLLREGYHSSRPKWRPTPESSIAFSLRSRSQPHKAVALSRCMLGYA